MQLFERSKRGLVLTAGELRSSRSPTTCSSVAARQTFRSAPTPVANPERCHSESARSPQLTFYPNWSRNSLSGCRVFNLKVRHGTPDALEGLLISGEIEFCLARLPVTDVSPSDTRLAQESSHY
jgi:hypothetical protein